MKTIALSVPFAAFPETAYDTVNERVAKRTVGSKSAWHAFAGSWNAIVYRLTAAHEHARQLALQGANPSPSFQDRYEYEREMFGWAAAAQSSVECGCFAALVVARVASGRFAPSRETELRFSPKMVAKELQQNWAGSRISVEIQRAVAATEYQQIEDFRRVLFHRGSVPRMVFLGAGGGSPRADMMPVNPADPADQWRYELQVTPTIVDVQMAWCDNTSRDLIEALEDFSRGW